MNKDRIRMVRGFISTPPNPVADAAKEKFAALAEFLQARDAWLTSVPGAAGSWRDLTDNVNLLAANLTTQVRAIAEVATAVTQGDLTRSITVEAS